MVLYCVYLNPEWAAHAARLYALVYIVQKWKFLPCFQQISIIKSLLLKLSLVKILILSIKTSKYNHSA